MKTKPGGQQGDEGENCWNRAPSRLWGGGLARISEHGIRGVHQELHGISKDQASEQNSSKIDGLRQSTGKSRRAQPPGGQ
jgi:hypothetical protein